MACSFWGEGGHGQLIETNTFTSGQFVGRKILFCMKCMEVVVWNSGKLITLTEFNKLSRFVEIKLGNAGK